MHADAGFAHIPVALWRDSQAQPGRRREQLEAIVPVILRRGGAHDQLELGVRADDGLDGNPQFQEGADEPDFIQEHRAGPTARGGDIRRDDLRAGIGVAGVIDAELQALRLKELHELGERGVWKTTLLAASAVSKSRLAACACAAPWLAAV